MTTLNLVVNRYGQTLGTAVMTVNERNIDVVASIASASFNLPAGRFLITTSICSKPTNNEAPTIIQTKDVTLNSPGTQTSIASGTFHAHKDVEDSNSGSIIGLVDIKQWDGTAWRTYASSWTTESASSVSFGPTGSTLTTQLRGANVHVFSIVSSNHASTITSLLDMMVDLGMDIVRTSTPWSFMESTTKGATDSVFQSEVDTFMNAASARNLKVVAIFGGSSPTWATTGRSTTTYTTAWNAKTYTFALYTPNSQQDLADGLNRYLIRWGSQLYAIEVLNEPNANNYPDSPANVVATTQTIYNTIKASAYPNIKVLGPSLAFSDTAYLSSLYTAGIKGYYDAMNIHPYHVKFSPNLGYDPRRPLDEPDFYHGIAGIEDIHSLQVTNSDSTPIWITESGFSTSTNTSSIAQGISEQSQGDYLKYMFRQASKLSYVDAFILHTMEDLTTDRSNWNGNFGISYTDHITHKPSYQVIKSTLAGLRSGSL